MLNEWRCKMERVGRLSPEERRLLRRELERIVLKRPMPVLVCKDGEMVVVKPPDQGKDNKAR
jgi:hypothetical protein